MEQLGEENVVGLSRKNNDFDLEDEESISKLSTNIKQEFRFIINATGILSENEAEPEKTIKNINRKNMLKIFSINSVGPALLIKYFSGHLSKKEKSIFVNLSARVGSIEDNQLGGWISYRSSKAALNQIIKTSSIEIKRKIPNSIIIGMHPGTVATNLSKSYIRNKKVFSSDLSAQMILNTCNKLNEDHSGCFLSYNGELIKW